MPSGIIGEFWGIAAIEVRFILPDDGPIDHRAWLNDWPGGISMVTLRLWLSGAWMHTLPMPPRRARAAIFPK
jgi:hypothetical protein